MIEVMLPFYGDPRLLREAVLSVVDQTSSDWRLLVIDDCAPHPGVRGWIESLGHAQVGYVRNSQNLGVARNFRHCLDLAGADYVNFMGCDDVMLPDYVATVSEAIKKHPEAAAVQPQVRVINEAGGPARSIVDRVKRALTPNSDTDLVLSGEGLAASLLRGNWMYFPAMTWRRDLIATHPFRDDMETVLDLDLLLDLVLDDQEIVLLPAEAFAYRRHDASASSITARSTARFEEEARLFAEVERRCSAKGWDRAQRAARIHLTSRLHAIALAPAALKSRQPETLKQLLKHAYQHG